MDKKKKNTLIAYLVGVLLLITVVLFFASQNAAEATVNFFKWSVNSTLAIFMIAALLVGAIITFLLSIPARFKHKTELRFFKKRVATLENLLQEQMLKNKKIDDAATLPERKVKETPVTDVENDVVTDL